jgi:ATP-dependent DNA helicase RecQ
LPSIHHILKTHFGYDAFRPQQEDIINAVLEGKDVLALLPTGGGKSLCYQVPGLAKEGLTLVISPLMALMKDQVQQLRRRNIPAAAIVSGMGFFDVKNTFQHAADGLYKFLYVSPERLQSGHFQEWLPSLNVTLIAVDEAHCISQWGYDFRPAYLQIARLREELPHVPVLALTASATQRVQDDICRKLLFKNEKVVRQSFARPNLSFSAFLQTTKYQKIKEVLANVKGSALIYCRNRRRTKEIAQLLQADGISASFYHAGLTAAERNQRQQEWLTDQTRVMACTNAFGMGIDKPNVRIVIHADVPECLENYYQEAGRAGRDGKRSYAVLLYTEAELNDLEKLSAEKYPLMYDIRKVYQSLCNMLNVPEGGGEGIYYPFDIKKLCEHWKLEMRMVVNVLKTLEQGGYVSFQENVFIPSRCGFTTGKAYLYEFEQREPALEPLIKCLLRTYEGIFDNSVSIHESTIARVTRLPEEEVKRQLQTLAYYNIVEYQPQKDIPQVLFLYPRIPKDSLQIDQKAYNERKQLYEQRVDTMVKFAAKPQGCRSEIIRRYFGDVQTTPCGICDVCLQQQQQEPTQAEISQLVHQLRPMLHQPLLPDEIRRQVPIRKALLDKTVQYMLDEEMIQYDAEGRLFVKSGL